jgi:small neutral amino acid transporter SnatA (MarC family)
LTPSKLSLSLNTLSEISAIVLGIFLSSISIYIFYRYSSYIIKKMDYSKQQIISKLSAFILLAIAIKMSLDGIKYVLL